MFLSSSFPSVQCRTEDFRLSLAVMSTVLTFLDLTNNFNFSVYNWPGQCFSADRFFLFLFFIVTLYLEEYGLGYKKCVVVAE